MMRVIDNLIVTFCLQVQVLKNSTGECLKNAENALSSVSLRAQLELLCKTCIKSVLYISSYVRKYETNLANVSEIQVN